MYANEVILFRSQGRSNYRIPSIVADRDGTIHAFCNDRHDTLDDHAEETYLVYARKRPGCDWESIKILDGHTGWCCMIGSAVHDTITGDTFCTFTRKPVAMNEFGDYTDEEIVAIEARDKEKAREAGIEYGHIIFTTSDGGDTWESAPINIEKRHFITADGREATLEGLCHGSASGIQLMHGEHAGRLLCPSRIYMNRYSTWDDAILACYNNSIYSDDHGKTWHTSAAVQQGTGEGTLIELANGDILYNSRNMRRDGTRLTAISTDGGETYHDFATDPFLFEEKNIGCNAAFLRVEACDIAGLPEGADSITLFTNPRAENRTNMTVCASFDSGKTWPIVKSVWPEGSAYSSIAYDKTTNRFFLLYEKGGNTGNAHEYGVALLEFDLEWLTGSGSAPASH